MNAPATHDSGKNEVRSVAVISLLAALHVFVFTAAFPFFTSVDEQLHFDLVVRYSQGHIPRQLEPISPEAIRYVALFHSLAYLADPDDLPGGKLPPPPWTQPVEKVLPLMLAREREWRTILNPEDAMPPLYYSLAGAWWNLGKMLGLDGERILYWLRFLNIFLVVAAVWLGWLAARKVFPENIFIRRAVPALMAFLPQTAFYSINSDILTPLVFGAAFLLLLKFWESEMPARRPALALGLALAATFLTKTSTLPLLAVSALFIAAKVLRLARGEKLRAALPSLAILSAGAALPAAAWML